MFKYLAFALLMSTAVFGRPSQEGGDDMKPEPLYLSEFKGEMANMKDSAVWAASRIDDVLQHATNAIQDPNAWIDFDQNFKGMVEGVGKVFEQEGKRVKGLFERLWGEPKDFLDEGVCNNMASLLNNLGSVTDAQGQFVVAMIADLGCLREAFQSAEDIPIESMEAGQFTELDALKSVQGAIEKMFFIHRVQERFSQAMKGIDNAMNQPAKREYALLEKLLRLARQN